MERLSVLLANDIPDHVRTYSTGLHAYGFDVVTAESGGEALTGCHQHRPACVVIDERLSDMRGWDLCAAFKADPALASIPIIMLAHEMSYEAAMRGRAVGCESWLARPSTAEDLARAIREVLKRKQSAPATSADALLSNSSCIACASPRTRAGVRVGPAQYFVCTDCGLRWRAEATGSATA